jgi:lipoprotein-anchoring transpeptidase ErfK/SrfK
MNAPVWRYRLGFLGSWTLCVVAAGAAGFAVAAERANLQDAVRLARLARIDRVIGSHLSRTVAQLKGAAAERGGRVEQLRSDVADATVDLDEPTDAAQTILISTAENRLWVRRGRQTLFAAVVSTGKGTTLTIGGRKMIFDTPTGRFHIQSKEENPVWVPPEWHYVEEARKKKLDLVRARPGDVIDAETGGRSPRPERLSGRSWAPRSRAPSASSGSRGTRSSRWRRTGREGRSSRASSFGRARPWSYRRSASSSGGSRRRSAATG